MAGEVDKGKRRGERKGGRGKGRGKRRKTVTFERIDHFA